MSEKRWLVCMPGDGIGPEVTEAMKAVVAAAGVGIDWLDMPLGLSALESHGDPLPPETLAAIRACGVAIKGPTTTPGGGGHTSVNVLLRREFDLYQGLRPVRSLGIPGTREGIELVLFRQNTEGLYACTEVVREGLDGGRTVELTAQFSGEAMRRLARAAFLFAERAGKTRVTYVDKQNIHKGWGRLYHEQFLAVAAEFPSIEALHLLVDATSMRLVMYPGEFQVLVTENMFGDILSDLCAGLVGGLGVAPGANIGDDCAIFEAVHGSAPDIAGKGIANPTALILSAVMMLRHIGQDAAATRIEAAVRAVYTEGRVITGDIAWRYGVAPSNTAQFVEAVIAKL